MFALERHENLTLATSTCSYYQENGFQKQSFYQLSIFASSTSPVRRQVYAKILLSLQANPKRLNETLIHNIVERLLIAESIIFPLDVSVWKLKYLQKPQWIIKITIYEAFVMGRYSVHDKSFKPENWRWKLSHSESISQAQGHPACKKQSWNTHPCPTKSQNQCSPSTAYFQIQRPGLCLHFYSCVWSNMFCDYLSMDEKVCV